MRLIDADVLMQATCDGGICSDCEDAYEGQNIHANCSEIRLVFLRIINDAPTIDIDRPQGEWLLLEPRYSIEQKVYWNKEQALADTKGNGALERRKCSCCGYTKQFSGYMKDKAFKLWPFCPNCGADMREREDE